MVFAMPVQLSIRSVFAPGLKLAKVSVPTEPVPKSRCDPVAVSVRDPTPAVLVLHLDFDADRFDPVSGIGGCYVDHEGPLSLST